MKPRKWRRLIARLLGIPTVAVGLSTATLNAAPPPEIPPPPSELIADIAGAPVAEPPPVDLPTLRQLALEKQPALVAYRSSLMAAETKSHAIDRIAFLGIIRRDLPIRRQQADQGTIAAKAQLTRAEYETLYSVTRTYLSVLYAEQQLKVADRALDEKDVMSLPYLRKVANEIYMNSTRKDVKKWNVDQIDVLTQQVRARREEALQGVQRATAALREAVGLEFDCPLPLVKGDLPNLNPRVEHDAIVTLARERRGEIIQSGVGAEVTSLEVSAQRRIFGFQAQTFAMGSDLHALPIPQGIANHDYHPGAIYPEMPNVIIGKRKDRVAQAEDLHGRAVAVVDKARHLVALEAEDFYYRWLQVSNEAAEYEKAAKAAEKVADEIRELFKPNDPQSGRPTLEDMLEARVKATQLRLLANQARFEHLLALAALERVTAGGFSAGFDASPAPKK